MRFFNYFVQFFTFLILFQCVYSQNEGVTNPSITLEDSVTEGTEDDQVIFADEPQQLQEEPKRKLEENVFVKTSSGKLRPKILKSRNGDDYYGFLGIPYAVPPINNLRYSAPSKVPSWEGIKNVTKLSEKCMQYNVVSEQIEGSEDCLYMNVFVPYLPTTEKQGPGIVAEEEQVKEKLPVMIFIHPGAFMFDSGNEYGAKYFMDNDVILVTFNYRLNIFGFLSTGDNSVQGNMGLKDQVMVLKYVQDEIEKFGGDPNLVTIFGDRSGGASVHYHMLSTMSKGLFSRAISQSGTALCPYAFDRQPRRSAKKLGTLLNCPTSNTLDLATCLRNFDAKKIMERIPQLFEWSTDPITAFGPSVENVYEETGVFLSDTPYRLIKSASIQNTHSSSIDVPWIVGVDDAHGYFSAASVLVNEQMTNEINQEWYRIAPYSFYFKDVALEPETVAMQVKAFYFGGENIGNATIDNLTSLYSDRYCFHCARVGALLHARMNEANHVYLYNFGYMGSSVLRSLGIENKKGPAEGDYLQYLFNMENQQEIFPEIKEGEDLEFSQKFIKLWVSFARTGRSPTWGDVERESEEEVENEKERRVEWKQISHQEVKGNEGLKYFKIDKQPEIISEPYTQRMYFWDNLPLNQFEDEIISPYSRRIDNIKSKS